MPIPVERSQSGPDIGLVSLPVLCCLLGAALFVYEYGGSEPTLTREFLELESRLIDDATTAQVLADRADEAEATLQLLAQAAKLVRAEQELATLTRQHAQLAEQAQLLASLEDQAPELAEARDEAIKLRAAQAAAFTPAELLFGGYRGDFVLVECIAEAIIIHPIGRRISLAELSEESVTLLREIDRMGYVAIAVRPDGWRDQSFDQVREIIRNHLATQTAQPEQSIRWTEFPLQTDESIEPYFPRRS
jgi:hypothetical protein